MMGKAFQSAAETGNQAAVSPATNSHWLNGDAERAAT
jgi:hypothetical protein